MKRFKALKFGTFASPSNRGVIYINPDHEEPKHHSPVLTDAEAQAARDRGLIEDGDGVEVDDDGNTIADTTTLVSVAQERLGDVADATDKVPGSAATLDSRQTTAWPDADRVLGGDDGAKAEATSPAVSTEVAGTQMADGSGGSDDDDAAPAPRRAARGSRNG